MKVLSFGAIEILPALLNKTKTQTVRPAWKMERYMKQHKSSMCKVIQFPTVPILKEPRSQVGDEIRLEWKSRNSPKGSWFCMSKPIEGTDYVMEPLQFGDKEECDNYMKPLVFKDRWYVWPKILGVGKITSVEGVKFWKESNNHIYIEFVSRDEGRIVFRDDDKEIEELAKRDGFPDAELMFKWFNEHYDLSSPKTFWVYRWGWEDGEF